MLLTWYYLFPSLFLYLSVLIPFLSFTVFYLNPILLKILLNYTYTISKVITLHIYILTSYLIFFTHFYLSLLLFLFSFIHFYLLYFSFYAFPSYFLTFPTHCLTVPKSILLYLVISYYSFNCKHCIIPSYCISIVNPFVISFLSGVWGIYIVFFSYTNLHLF